MSEYDDSSDWADDLTRLASSVTPAPEAGRLVRAGIKRRQRRRAAVAVVGGAAAVAVVAGSTFAISRPTADTPATPAAPSTTAVSPPSSAPPSSPSPAYTPLVNGFWEEPKPGDCPGMSKVFDPAAAPPIVDLAEQQQVVEEITARVRNAYTVRYARATALGVVALVMGDLDVAKEQLAADGVELVYAWDPSGPEVGLDEEGQVHQIVGWQFDPVINELRRSIRGISADGGSGEGHLALWMKAGAVLLQWKAPVPDDVRALEDRVWRNGVRVVVEGVRYSQTELTHAGFTVLDRARTEGIEVSSASGCGDLSGLAVGVGRPDLLGHEAELKQKFTDWTGMPVTVFEEAPPVDLMGSTGVGVGQPR